MKIDTEIENKKEIDEINAEIEEKNKQTDAETETKNNI